MKKSLPYEIAATLSAIFGVFLLIGVLLPIINPEQTRIESHNELPSIGHYIIMTPIALFVLAYSWTLNKKARAIKAQFEKSAPVAETAMDRKLKWIVGAIVIFLVLCAFIW